MRAVAVLFVALCAIACVSAEEAELEVETEIASSQSLSVWGTNPCATTDVAGVDYQKEFAAYCKVWGKRYKPDAIAARFAIWKQSYNCVAAHNAKPDVEFVVRLNAMSDHLPAEFFTKLGGQESTPEAFAEAANSPVISEEQQAAEFAAAVADSPAPVDPAAATAAAAAAAPATSGGAVASGVAPTAVAVPAAAPVAAAAPTPVGANGQAIPWAEFATSLKIVELEAEHLLHEMDTVKKSVSRNTKAIRRLKAKTGLGASLLEVETEVDVAGQPRKLDWRKKGAVTRPANQGQCGNCWAWTAKSLAESAWKIAGNNLKNLSPQQITDCARGKYTHGCNGGNAGVALNLMMKRGGFCPLKKYKLSSKQRKCKTCRKAAQISGVKREYEMFPNGRTENDLQTALQTGPVGVSVYASPASFMHYSGGVYNDAKCNRGATNHAVVVVGYGKDKKHGAYWIIKNSWGTQWGERGYMRLKRGKNRCKIMTEWVQATSAKAGTFGMTRSAPSPADTRTDNKVEALSPVNRVAGKKCVAVAPSGKSFTGKCESQSSCNSKGRYMHPRGCKGATSNLVCCLKTATEADFERVKKLSRKQRKSARKAARKAKRGGKKGKRAAKRAAKKAERRAAAAARRAAGGAPPPKRSGAQRRRHHKRR